MAQALEYLNLLMAQDLTHHDDIAHANALVDVTTAKATEVGPGVQKDARNSAKTPSDDVTSEFVRLLDAESTACQSHGKDHA